MLNVIKNKLMNVQYEPGYLIHIFIMEYFSPAGVTMTLQVTYSR